MLCQTVSPTPKNKVIQTRGYVLTHGGIVKGKNTYIQDNIITIVTQDIKIFQDANNKESSIQISITRTTYKSKGSAIKVTYKKHAQTWKSQRVMTTYESQE